MFDPIKAPDVFRGPAVGETTEFGTTWHEAVKRINAFAVAIEARFNALEGKTAAPVVVAPPVFGPGVPPPVAPVTHSLAGMAGPPAVAVASADPAAGKPLPTFAPLPDFKALKAKFEAEKAALHADIPPPTTPPPIA
jgi:hypothetical protein